MDDPAFQFAVLWFRYVELCISYLPQHASDSVLKFRLQFLGLSTESLCGFTQCAQIARVIARSVSNARDFATLFGHLPNQAPKKEPSVPALQMILSLIQANPAMPATDLS
jgi:hypothetical protein